MLFFISFAAAFSVKLSDTSPCDGILQISYNSDASAYIMVTFPYITFPHLRQFDNIVAMTKTTNNDLCVVLYCKTRCNMSIYYDKVILPANKYEWNAERGFYIPPVYCIQKTKAYKSDPVFDICYVPDFTVPFLAFNTCSCIFSFVLGIIVKQRLNKAKTKTH